MTSNNKGTSKNKNDFFPNEQYPAASKLKKWQLIYDRLGWEILGVIFISLAIITLLGFLSLSQGKLVKTWIDFLQLWLGWGSYLLVVAFAWIGYIFLSKRVTTTNEIQADKIVVIEVGLFLLLTFLSVLGGNSLARASDGLDGGQIGWGIVEQLRKLLPLSLIGIFSGVGFFICFLYATGLSRVIIHLFQLWAEKVLKDEGISNNSDTIGIAGKDFIQKNPLLGDENDPLMEGADFDRKSEHLPSMDILKAEEITPFSDEKIHITARKLENTLAEFGIPARVVGFRVGPTVTQFAVEPGYVERIAPDGQTGKHKVRVSQISALTRDLSLALSAERLRIEAPVPGQSFVGIEVPNPRSSIVGMRSILESEEFQKLNVPLGIALGKDVSGRPVVADLSKMPHLLIAGTTGSGKSVCIAALAACLVMNNTPDQLRLVMLDPKMVELTRFNGLRHIIGKVETDPDRIPVVLRWALKEMDRRYRLLETAHCKNIETYNHRAGRKSEMLSRIVIMIDELADLMLSSPDQTEHCIVRLAQMARATGIHLVVATQRPSTDVVTGLIKANFPARISFNVASSIDSRVILDGNGAETLLGKGDMLFLNPERSTPIRAQGVIITDDEIGKIIDFWRDFNLKEPESAPWEELIESSEAVSSEDKLVEEAIKIVRKTQHASASLLQRRLRIGYPRAARLIDELEGLGIVGPSQGGGKERDVLVSEEDDDENENDGDDESNEDV